MRVILVAIAALSLAGCATQNGAVTAQSCMSAKSKLSVAQAALDAAQAGIPALQLAAENALEAASGNAHDKAYVTAQAVLGVTEAAIPGLQAILSADQAVVASQCAGVS